MWMQVLTKYTTRYTMKVSFIAGEDPAEDCIKMIKAIFKQITQVGDIKAFIALWYDNDEEVANISNISQFSLDKGERSNYFSRFFIHKGMGSRVKYLQINISYVESITDIKREIRG